jgi:2-polyprenyl-3-methyl-5-hydroxy-6-metoxy-1,4-benzoquinol methylase
LLATRPIPARYQEWNGRWSAPGGRRRRPELLLPDGLADEMGRRWPQLRGPFGFQDNSATRLFEFPWAYYEIDPRPGMKALEIGGSNSGMQFVLDRAGVEVTNVDPGEEASGVGWPVDAASIARLNRAFKTHVTLVNTTLQDAKLPSEHFDVVYSISTIEHIPADEYPSLMSEVRRVLKPGGRMVMTVDLFLNLAPFCSRTSNEWGTNADVAELVSMSGLRLVEGDRTRLYGFPEFAPDEIVSGMESFTFGTYPVAAQCLVLQRD